MYTPTTIGEPRRLHERRRSRLLPTVACLALVLGTVGTASAQSAFTRKQLSGYAKLAASIFVSNRFYDLDGKLNDDGQNLELYSAALYAEVGVVDQLTVMLDWQVFRANAYAESTTAYGIGDLRLGLKYGLRFGRHHVAAIVAPEFPTGNSEATVSEETTLVTGRVVERKLGLPTGDGEFNIWNRLAYSVSVNELDAWASADFGVNWRTQGFAHQLAMGAEVGHFLLRHVYLMARIRGQLVPSNDLKRGSGFIFGEGTEFLSVGAGLAAPIPRTPIAATFDWLQIVGLAQNVYAGPQVLFGASVEWGPR